MMKPITLNFTRSLQQWLNNLKSAALTLLMLFVTIAAFAAQPVISSFSPAKGAVGTFVTLNGAGLSGTRGLVIGGVPAIIISVNDSKVVGMVMPGAITGSINLDAGNLVTATGNFMVTATPFPLMANGDKLTGVTTGNPQKIVSQGRVVAISADGSTAAIVGDFDNGASIKFFSKSGKSWVSASDFIRPKSAPTGFGNAISISGDGTYAIVGSYIPSEGGSISMSAFVFMRKNGVWNTESIIKLDREGHSVGISADGNSIILGRIGLDGRGILNGVFIYRRTGDNSWERQPGLPNSTDYDAIPGASVAMSADAKTVAVVSGYKSYNEINYTRVYSRSSATASDWAVVGDYPFTDHVALSADGGVLLMKGESVGIYNRNSGGYSLVSKLPVSDPIISDYDLSADGKTIIIRGLNTNRRSVVRAYTYEGGAYVLKTPIDQTRVGTGTIAISANGSDALVGEFRDDNKKYVIGGAWAFTDKATPTTATPTGYANTLKFSNTTSTSTTVGWTSGNGSSRAVFVKAGGGATPALVDGTAYAANANFASATQVGTSGWYCVYNGTGSTTNITGLAPGVKYYAVVIDYNGTDDDGNQKYFTSQVDPGNVTTLISPPDMQASAVIFSNVTGATATVSWVNGNGVGRAVFISNSATGSPLPADVYYSANGKFAGGNQIGTTGWYCIYNGTGTTVNITQLTNGNTYRVAVVEYNGTLAAPKYSTANISPVNATTLIEAPTGYATALVFTNTAAKSATLSWVNSNGAGRAVFMRVGTSGLLPVTNGTTYVADVFGQGTQVGTSGWYCIYNGTGNSVTITGLSASTTYRAVVIEYNGAGATSIYNIARYNGANVTTIAAPLALASINQKQGLLNVVALADEVVIDGGLIVHQGVSPNGDGVNDIFTIDGIAAYPENTVQVINTNGEVIYSATGYNNSSKAFDGHAANGILQKAGTYFYSLEYKNGVAVIRKTGYLVIKF